MFLLRSTASAPALDMVFRKDERIDEKYDSFLKTIYRGRVNVPHDLVCHVTWFVSGFVLFCEVLNYTCRTLLYNLLMIISEYHDLNMDRNHGNTMANILFKNHLSSITTLEKERERESQRKKYWNFVQIDHVL